MIEAKKLNKLWRKGDRAKVLKRLTRGGKIDFKLLTYMLDINNQAALDAMRFAADLVR